MRHTPDTLAKALLENDGKIFGKDFSEIEDMQQGRRPKVIPRSGSFRVGDRLKYKDVNLWHPRHAMTVIGTRPLRVKYERTGKEGEESESNVVLDD